MNSYELSRYWFEFSFNNPDKIKPAHSAVYFFAIEHCNRLGWKQKFGFPSQMVMEAIGIKNWRTYSQVLNELVEWGFIEMIEISKNQYSSNIIAIVKNTKAPTKALDKALSKHLQKQGTKQGQSIVSIDKQITNNKEQEYRSFAHLSLSQSDFIKLNLEYTKEQIDSILNSIENYAKNKSYTSLYLTSINWLKKEYPKQVNKDSGRTLVEIMKQR